MLTWNTLERASCFKNNFSRKQHTCARLARATQHQRHTYVLTRTCRQPPRVVLRVIYVEADLHPVYCCICCTLSDSFILHITTDRCIWLSSYFVRTYFSSGNTLMPDFLPLPIHQRHVRVANQPVWCEWTKNEYCWESSQGSPYPPLVIYKKVYCIYCT